VSPPARPSAYTAKACIAYRTLAPHHGVAPVLQLPRTSAAELALRCVSTHARPGQAASRPLRATHAPTSTCRSRSDADLLAWHDVAPNNRKCRHLRQ
jgi:hypothetical protein